MYKVLSFLQWLHVQFLHLLCFLVQTWVCEFCGTSNTVDLVPEEIPVEEDTTYLVTAAAAAQAVDHSSGTNAEESIVVFCIDTSGSMCVTTEVRVHTCMWHFVLYKW